MIKILLIIFAFLFSSLSADEWNIRWNQGTEYWNQKNYPKAEEEILLAIDLMRAESDYVYPMLFIDLARIYCEVNRFHEAISLTTYTLELLDLSTNERIAALITRIYAYSQTERDHLAREDYQSFIEIFPEVPVITHLKEKIIITNVPDCDCYKKTLRSFYVGAEICEEEDIQFLEKGVCIIKKKKCNCGCKDVEAKTQAKPRPKQRQRPIREPNQPRDNRSDRQKVDDAEDDVTECKYWCEKVALGCVAVCNKTFKTWKCQTACLLVVEALKDGCFWCCKGGSFYGKCVKPFEDVISKMGEGCDPQFD